MRLTSRALKWPFALLLVASPMCANAVVEAAVFGAVTNPGIATVASPPPLISQILEQVDGPTAAAYPFAWVMHATDTGNALCVELKDGLLALMQQHSGETPKRSPSPSESMALTPLRIDTMRTHDERLPNADIYGIYIPERLGAVWSYSPSIGKIEALPWPREDALRLVKQLSDKSESVVLLPRGIVVRLSDLQQPTLSIPPGSFIVRLDRMEASRSCTSTFSD